MGQVLASSSIAFCSYQLPITSIIIELKATDHFFTNKNLMTNYKKYQQIFELSLGKKIIARSYREVILQLQLLDKTVNTFRVTNVS